ncbi:MAG: hypothetical protein S4CHLAM81_03550 [Chlamydiales bacterium]|nr:hypothetical protein [Chlamydiales bacterium]MCH9635145.1 hypothetical protein [Chlamydiales bacterium]MCH9704410.1 CPBP family intramembrane metalloprotease [Chlamydiota bacterium]
MKYLLLYGISALLAILYMLVGPKQATYFVIFGIVMMWVPGILALIFAKREKMQLQIFCRPKFDFLAVGLRAIFVVLLITAVSLPFGQFAGVEHLRYSMPSFFHALSPLLFTLLTSLYFVAMALLAGLTVNLFAALGEELMWRGYLWEKLKHHGVLKASLLIGLLWGVWHAPLIVLFGINYPDMPILGVVMMVLSCMALSPILCAYRAKGKPIIYPAIFHGTINGIAGVTVLLFTAPNLFWIGVPGVVGIVTLSILSLIEVATLRKKQSRI